MNRIQRILVRARDTLADPEAQRWSNDRLLRILDEGQKDISNKARLLKQKAELPVIANEAIVSLPERTWRITRVLYGDRVLPLTTHEELDRRYQVDRENNANYSYNYTSYRPSYSTYTSETWETETGPEPLAAVFNLRSIRELKLYPIPDGSLEEEFEFDRAPIPPALDPVFQAFGVVTDVGLRTFNSRFGTITDFALDFDNNDQGAVLTSPFGITTNIAQTQGALIVYYIEQAPDITSEFDELVIDPLYDQAMKYYVTGMALRDDLDTRNRAMGAEELEIYNRELELAKKADFTDNTRTTQFTSIYRGVL